MNKIIIFSFALCCLQDQTSAQENERKVLFKNSTTEFTVIDFGYYSTYYNSIPLYGGTFGIKGVFKNHLGVGFDFDFTGTKQVVLPQFGQVVTPRFSYMGFTGVIEYLLFPHRMVNISFPVKTGLGYTVYNDYSIVQYVNYNFGSPIYKNVADDFFFVFEPGIKLHFNLTKKINLFFGSGYRFSAGVNTIGNNNDFTRFSYQGGIRLFIDENEEPHQN